MMLAETSVVPMLCLAVDTVLAGLVLLRPWAPSPPNPGPPVIHLGHVVAAALATSVAFAVKLPLAAELGVDMFGVFHLAYLDVVVLLPLIGVAVVWAARRRSDQQSWRRARKPVLVIAWASLLLVPIGVYATYVEPYRLQLETADVPLAKARAGDDPVRVGILADLQTDRVTDYERRAVDRLLAERPDIILMPGDLFQGDDNAFERELPALRDLLSRLSAPGGVYGVIGNVDREGRVERCVEGTSVQLLRNRMVTAVVGDRRVTIAGVDWPPQSAAVQGTIRRLESAPGSEDILMLMTHSPDAVESLSPDSRIDLVVAGHTHGGQIVLPLLGPPFTACGLPRHVAAGGLHDLDGRLLYISRGVGHERSQAPRIRFLAPPEISVLTLGN